MLGETVFLARFPSSRVYKIHRQAYINKLLERDLK